MEFLVFAGIAFILIFVLAYRNSEGDKVYKYISK